MQSLPSYKMTDTYFEKIILEPYQLSDSQKEAVISENRYIRLIAGAGAGKTETLTRRILYLLFVKKVLPGSIIAFTFTEKAAATMKNRIFQRVLGLGAVDIYNQLGDMFIGTIHGYCNRLLEEHYGFGSWEILDENQEMAFLMHISGKINLSIGRNPSDKSSVFKQSLSVVYNDLISRKDLGFQAPDFNRAVIEYERYLDSFHLLTFDRLIVLALEKLQQNIEAINQIKYIIVDEYQDINLAQEKLIQILGLHSEIFVVGDPRQTIYQWRGSDEGCFQRFTHNYPNVHDIVLLENRRSANSIVKIANSVASHFFTRQYQPMIPTRSENGHCYLINYPSPGDEAEGIADHILSLVNSGVCRYQDIGILLRSVNNSGAPFLKTLRRYHIPFTLSGQIGLFKRLEILALGKIFSWIPDKGFFPETIHNRKKTISGDNLLISGLNDWFEVIPSKHSKESVFENLNNWKELVREGNKYKNITDAYYNLLSILGFYYLTPDNQEHSVMICNIASFGRVLADFESSHNYGGIKTNNLQFLQDLFWYIYLYAYWKYEESASEHTEKIDAVRLSTVHQAKGLEWPVLFLPSLICGKFPSSRTGEERKWLIPRKLFSPIRYEGNIEGERQLFYVAITRARDILCMSWYEDEGESSSIPSQFIENEIGTENAINLPYTKSFQVGTCLLPDLDVELYSFPAKELILFQQCPYRYRLNKEWGFLPGLSPDLGYGNALHNCLGEIATLIKQGISADKAVNLAIDSGFFLPFAEKERFDIMKQSARDRLMTFAIKREDDLRKVKQTEYRIEYPVRNGVIVGKIDVIIEGSDGVEIRDYKTSEEVISPEEAKMQLQIYAYGLQILGGPVSSGSIAYIEDARIEQVPVSPDDIAEIKIIVENLIEQILNEKFPAKPGKQCERCDYFQICRYRSGLYEAI